MRVKIVISIALAFLSIALVAHAGDWQELQRQKNIERAEYWVKKGYRFDPNYMSAYAMDQKVKDIERAEYWKKKGYDFDPNYMSAYAMDQKVKDIERANYWKKQGYEFDPNYMSAYAMDQEVARRKQGKSLTITPPIRYYVGSYRSYNYDVSGYSDSGEYVYGEIDVDQSGGDGYIYDENGDEVYIDVEWTGKGELEGYDSDGNYYELEVD